MSKKPYVISFANQKGGVGKTTSCVNIAAAIGAKGYNVLLIDCDPQGNSTTGVGISKKSIQHSVYDALLGTIPAAECVVKTQFDHLYVVPATINLAGAEFELFDIEQREKCLSRFISEASEAEGFDFVMIDCPPSLSMLTVNALTASNGVIIPMQSEYYALEGLTQLMLTIKKVKQHYNPTLSILGILITMHNPRLNLSVQVLDELKKYYSDKLFKTMIPRAVKLSEAPGFGTPAMYHDKFNKGTKAYDEVAEEILHRIGIIL
ncbi:MAG: ParA family protein [Ruminococcaceae bacterium]|nr:ParA family protein [Oscillospiraceae bacterium]